MNYNPMAGSTGGAYRTTGWTFTVYPESQPAHWRQVMEGWHVPAIISPLHDRDVWTEADEESDPNHKAGELKKPHYHVILQFGSVKNAKQVLGLAGELGVHHVEPVHDMRAMQRYLCHLDNPEKASYPVSDVQVLNGAVYDTTRTFTVSEQAKMCQGILAFASDNDIVEYCDLLDVLPAIDFDWYIYAINHTNVVNGYLRSRRNKLKDAVVDRNRERHEFGGMSGMTDER